ncbi:hypothetical protein O7632_00455 [Solwaraspora sp. WMMD406]|uniref:hypothetical protein n=1 Tax=Solwaraspora sp. WMMD406 TaxID=3016095 RepID=UPI002415FCBA|nr:hypothetical protein [Solwaraspora sp. WMMD406]MDG4762593.1 hypothetical protein [Solwaraspora sp. WMMD406]
MTGRLAGRDGPRVRPAGPGRTRSRLVAALAGAVVGLAAATTSGAVPPGGASPDTPGTASSVSPRDITPGSSISFQVSGFPPGESVNIKIDDGDYCGEAAVHGACVVHIQQIAADGTVSGSVPVPADLPPGAHWLRYLATEQFTDANGNAGTRGYTLRGGSDFTVVAAGGTPGPDPEGTPAGGSPPGAGTAETAPPPVTDSPAAGAVSASASGQPEATPSGVAVVRVATDGGLDGNVLLWAILGVASLAAIGGIVVQLVRRRSRPDSG